MPQLGLAQMWAKAAAAGSNGEERRTLTVAAPSSSNLPVVEIAGGRKESTNVATIGNNDDDVMMQGATAASTATAAAAMGRENLSPPPNSAAAAMMKLPAAMQTRDARPRLRRDLRSFGPPFREEEAQLQRQRCEEEKTKDAASTAAASVAAASAAANDDRADATKGTEVEAVTKAEAATLIDAGAAYEREREERILRNREIMRNLGIDSMVSKGIGGGEGGDEGGGGGGKRGAATDPSVREAQRRAKAARAASSAAASASASVPIRRSSRSTRHLGSFTDEVDAAKLSLVSKTNSNTALSHHLPGASSEHTQRTAAAVAAASVPEETFDDSSVLRYACGSQGKSSYRGGGGGGVKGKCSYKDGGGGGGGEDGEPGDTLLGFTQIPVVFADGATRKGFYSLDATDGVVGEGGGGGGEGRGASRPLLVGGGDGGRVSIFGLAGGGEGTHSYTHDCIGDGGVPDEGSDDGDEEMDEDGCRWESPLMSWVAHRGWCSQVQFIPPSYEHLPTTAAAGANPGRAAAAMGAHNLPPRVLSGGGMDGVVTLWDVGKSGGISGQPRKVCSADDLHRSGIFSMHAAWGRGWGGGGGGGGYGETVRLLTGSKDATENGGITLERRFVGHHGGVVKCVRWRCDHGGGGENEGNEGNRAAGGRDEGGIGGGSDDDDRTDGALAAADDDAAAPARDNARTRTQSTAGAAPVVFASCGNDGRLCVMDARCGVDEECVGAVDDAHGGGAVNFVEWARNTCPSSLASSPTAAGGGGGDGGGECQRAYEVGGGGVDGSHLLLTSGLGSPAFTSKSACPGM